MSIAALPCFQSSVHGMIGRVSKMSRVAEEWLEQAEYDLETAEHMLSTGRYMAKTAPSVERIIHRYREQLIQLGIRPQKIVLFGSYAEGTADEWSDVDLLVISPDFEGMEMLQRLEALGIAAARIWEPVEALGYTPEEVSHTETATFLYEVLHTGIVIWEEEKGTVSLT